jgi:hypothetical protein
MVFDRSDHLARQKEREAVKTRRTAPQLRQVAQAEVPMTALTGIREWDLYHQVVQAMIVDAEEEKRAQLARLEDPSLLDPTQITAIKFDLHRVKTAISTMQELLDLPRVLVERAREAKKLLKRYDIEI